MTGIQCAPLGSLEWHGLICRQCSSPEKHLVTRRSGLKKKLKFGCVVFGTVFNHWGSLMYIWFLFSHALFGVSSETHFLPVGLSTFIDWDLLCQVTWRRQHTEHTGQCRAWTETALKTSIGVHKARFLGQWKLGCLAKGQQQRLCGKHLTDVLQLSLETQMSQLLDFQKPRLHVFF